jgi:hypothetical protein
MNRLFFWILLFLAAIACYGQNKNPDISVITDFRAFSQSGPGGAAGMTPLTFDLAEIEAAVQGYLNPYSRADIFFAKHGVEGALEIEEAYITFLRGLPLGMNIKAGKYLVDFSKLNTLHPHAYPFIDRPLLHQLYFGEDGWNDIGMQLNVLLPTGSLYTQWSVNVLKGDPAHAHEEEDTGASHAVAKEAEHPLAWTSRLSSHAALTDRSNVEWGLNAGHATYDPDRDLAYTRFGLDAKYKWKPNAYRSLTLQAEALLEYRKVAAADSSSPRTNSRTFGFFAFANYQFRKRWNIGAMAESLQPPGNESEHYSSWSAFVGFSPMEETSVIRLLYQHIEQQEKVDKIILQLSFSLGPHKAHLF